MAIVVGIFVVDDQAVEAVGNVLQAVNLMCAVVFGGVGLAGERRSRNLTPNPFPRGKGNNRALGLGATALE